MSFLFSGLISLPQSSLNSKLSIDSRSCLGRGACLENPHGQRGLWGYSPWGRQELDRTERLSTAHYIHIHRTHTLQPLYPASSVRHADCFHVLAAAHSTAVNPGVCIFLQIRILSKYLFAQKQLFGVSFLRSLRTVLSSLRPATPSRQQGGRALFSPHPSTVCCF